MIAEGEKFERFIRETFFLQSTIDFGCGAGRLAPLFDPALYFGYDTDSSAIAEANEALGDTYTFVLGHDNEEIGHAYAVLIHDTFVGLSDEVVDECFKRFRQPRVVITEILGERGMMGYSDIAKRNGYWLHRCLFIPSMLSGEIAALEFHLKDEGNDQIRA